MTTPAVATRESWHQMNQRHLSAAVERVRWHLRRHIERRRANAEPPADAPPLLSEDASPPDAPSAIAQLTSTFRLSPFERDVVLLCAGMELDSSFAALCATAQGDAQRPYPTFSLALAALDGAHWSALTPAAPLRRWRMVEVMSGHALTSSQLRIDERVLHYLTGVDGRDDRLAGIVEPVPLPTQQAPTHRALAERMAAIWAKGASLPVAPVIQLCGDGERDKRAIASTAAGLLGLKLLAISAELIPSVASESEGLVRLLQREAALSGVAIYLDCGDGDAGDAPRTAAITRFIDRVHGALVIGSRERRRVGQRPSMSLDVSKPTAPEQRSAWRDALGDLNERLNGKVEQLVSQFNLSAHAIEVAGHEARTRMSEGVDENAAHVVWDASRAQARPRLDDLAQRIDIGASWDDLVLPDGQRQLLRDIAAHVRQRATVYEQWGFASHGSRGLGISALFAGTSGTGKTMAAEVLANELRLDLYRIDLASVVSKYIGETEKNLRRIFDAAEDGGAILLFDEADALFGKRSEVKDSHDRYANIEVSYLLQRMECYRGLAILTTNMRSALDSAFLRRIRFIVQFPFPDPVHRAEIWRRVFPPRTPCDGLAEERLAQLNVSGGNIRNIALNAAFLAADAGEPVRMTHLLRAARNEYAKMERPLTDAEIAGWTDGSAALRGESEVPGAM